MLPSNHFANLSCILRDILYKFAAGKAREISTLKKSTKGPVFSSSKLLKLKGTICLRVHNSVWLYLIQSSFVYVNFIENKNNVQTAMNLDFYQYIQENLSNMKKILQAKMILMFICFFFFFKCSKQPHNTTIMHDGVRNLRPL